MFTSESVLNCNFEAGSCQWKTDTQSNHVWKIIAGKTFSNETGPSADHTSGSSTYVIVLVVVNCINFLLQGAL